MLSYLAGNLNSSPNGKFAKVVDLQVASKEHAVEVSYTYELPLPKQATVQVTYLVDGTGKVNAPQESSPPTPICSAMRRNQAKRIGGSSFQ